MRIFIILLLILAALIANLVYSQTYSNITYDAGTSIDIQTAADVCATTININGTFSGGGTICTGALPVSISSFTFSVNKREITLSWVTEYELNNSGFEVERRSTPLIPPEGGTSQWNKIGFVPGSGTTNQQKSYTFMDKKLTAGKYQYRLKQIDYNSNYEYFQLEGEPVISQPKEFSISQNYPNPSNPKSKIDFELPIDGKVSLRIYDILGREVTVLINEFRKADFYTVEFDGTNLASGVYLYHIAAEGNGEKFTKTMKMVLVK